MIKEGLDKCQKTVVECSIREFDLLKRIRGIPFGEVVVKIENNQPTRIIVARENILLS